MKPAKNGLTVVVVTVPARAVDARNLVAIKTARRAADAPVAQAVPALVARVLVALAAMATAIVPVGRVTDRHASINATNATSARVRKPRRNRRNSTPVLHLKKKASNPSPARSK